MVNKHLKEKKKNRASSKQATEEKKESVHIHVSADFGGETKNDVDV